MKTFILIISTFLGLTLALACLGLASYVLASNEANRDEQGIVATWQDNENNLANYGKTLSEMAQVPAMARDDILKVFTGALEARYGKDGSRATMQWMREHNPELDQKSYARLMTAIEAGRKDFTNGQSKLIDQVRNYRTALGSVWTGAFMKMAGYPKIDLDKYKPVSSERAADAFATHREEAITIRP